MLKEVEMIVREVTDAVFYQPFSVMEKGGYADVVTSSDKAIQERLATRLSELLPGSGFLGEEDGLLDEEEDMWIIDPIDGTQNFSRGIEACCVSVGLVHQKESILGVVYMPFLNKCYTAEKGKGAFCNGKRISVSHRPFSDAILCTALCLYHKEYAKVCSDIIFDAYLSCNDVRRFGSCAYELCQMAEGKTDLYFEISISPWDFTGSEIILKEAGGYLKGFDLTDPPHVGSTPLVGANSLENLEKLNAIIKRHLPNAPIIQ